MIFKPKSLPLTKHCLDVCALQLFRWVWRQRNALRSLEPPEIAAEKTGLLIQKIIDAASVLLITVPHDSAPRSLLFVPGMDLLPSSDSPTQKSSHVFYKFQRCLLVIRGVIRWKALVKSSLGVSRSKSITTLSQTDGGPNALRTAAELVSFLQQISELPKARVGSPLIQPLLRPKPGFTLEVLVYMVLDNHRRALIRDLGLRSFRLLLSTTRMPSLLCEVLHSLGPALRDNGSTAGYYLTQLEAVGERLHRQVQRSFESLFEDICQKMRDVLQDAEQGNENLAQSHELGTGWDVGLLMTLVEVWGLKFRERDWSFLVNVGIFDVLHKLIKTLNGMITSPERMAASSNHSEEGGGSRNSGR
jgi:hypothetical protein